jgi:hypothetical protein
MVGARYAGGPAVTISADGTVRVNNTVVTLPASLGTTGTVQGSGSQISVLWVDGDRLDVTVNGGWLDYTLGVRDVWMGQLSGLCGTFNGVVNDDFTRRNGTALAYPPSPTAIDVDFGASWRLINGDPGLLFYAAGETTATFTDLTFPATIVTTSELPPATHASAQATCQNAGAVQPDLLDACILDVGVTGNTALARSSASVPVPSQGSTPSVQRQRLRRYGERGWTDRQLRTPRRRQLRQHAEHGGLRRDVLRADGRRHRRLVPAHGSGQPRRRHRLRAAQHPRLQRERRRAADLGGAGPDQLGRHRLRHL